MHGADDDRAVRIAVEVTDCDLRPDVHREVHAVARARRGLRHADPARGLSAGLTIQIEGQEDLVAAVLVERRCRRARRAVDSTMNEPVDVRLLRVPRWPIGERHVGQAQHLLERGVVTRVQLQRAAGGDVLTLVLGGRLAAEAQAATRADLVRRHVRRVADALAHHLLGAHPREVRAFGGGLVVRAVLLAHPLPRDRVGLRLIGEHHLRRAPVEVGHEHRRRAHVDAPADRVHGLVPSGPAGRTRLVVERLDLAAPVHVEQGRVVVADHELLAVGLLDEVEVDAVVLELSREEVEVRLRNCNVYSETG